MRDLADASRVVAPAALFSTWLLRPYLDLGPCQVGPTHARAIEAGWQACADPERAFFFPQRALSPGFRAQLAAQAGSSYAVDDPRELADELQSDRWRKLCDNLESWQQIPSALKCRVAALLHVMCFYKPLLELIPPSRADMDGDPFAAQLAFCRASAKFMLDLPGRTSGYMAETMAMFEQLATGDRVDEQTGFNAAAMVFVQKAKSRAPLAELQAWSERLKLAFGAVGNSGGAFTAQLLESRFYRGMGFLPQAAGDREAMIATMDLAERLARDLTATTAAEEVLYRENLHAVLESRTKEALWLDDIALAESRASELVRVDPYDSKAWVELGQIRYVQEKWRQAAEAYIVAAMLGPPASTVGRHMAAVCLRKLDLDFLAAFLFKETLEMDPIGISSRQEILELPDTDILDTLKQWARANIRL